MDSCYNTVNSCLSKLPWANNLCNHSNKLMFACLFVCLFVCLWLHKTSSILVCMSVHV